MSVHQLFQIDDKFRALVENTPHTVVIADEACSIIYCNKNITATFGYSPLEVQSQSLTILVPETHRATQKQEVEKLVQNKESIYQNATVELPALRKNGTVFTMEFSLSHWRGEDAKVYIFVIIRDITSRKKVEEDLDKEHQFLKAILENAEEAIIGCDENGVINYSNQPALEKYGIQSMSEKPENWISDYQLFNPDGVTVMPLENKPLFRALQGEIIKNQEVVIVTGTGKRLNLIANGRRIICKENLIRGAVIVLHDVTVNRQTAAALEEKNRQILQSFDNLKEAEKKLIESNQLLESKVNDRTKELTEKNLELNTSNEALQKVNTDLDNFLYIASHDLKVPLINMEVLLKLLHLDTGDQDPDVSDLIDKLQTSVEGMKKTIKAISEIAQVQKQVQYQHEIIHLTDVLTEITDSIAEQIKIENAQLDCDFSEAGTIRFSYVNLKSILYNLITNAIKYKSADRSPHIKITTQPVSGGIALRVKDNGLGMDLEKNGKKLFVMFSRLHDHVDGSGIGLYVIKRIIENSGGSIEVSSTLGEGSEFTVYFKNQE